MNDAPKNKRRWRIVRGIAVTLAVLTTLIAAFYTEEDWRGKRAWENCKSELAAQGVELDWNKFLPPNVPDDQNFYTASTNILQKFRQAGPNDANLNAIRSNRWLQLNFGSPPPFPILNTSKSGPVVVATIIVSSSTASGQLTGTNTLALNDPDASEKARALIRGTVGQSIDGAQGFKFSGRQLTAIPPAQILVQAQTAPSVSELESLVPSDSVTNIGQLHIAPTANQNVFQVSLTGVRITAASDYLKWSDQFVPAFDDIREALKRPYAILPGDYSNPVFMPIPDFVTMRALAQTLAQRAQCDLLLGKPDDALQNLTLIHDSCRILEKPGIGHPESLVEAMIDVAITELYAAMIAEGLQRHAWQEPQLITLQKQLKETDLCPVVLESLREQPAHLSRMAEMATLSGIAQMITPPVWGSIRPFRWAVPRGWLYQMMAVTAKLESETLTNVYLENNTVFPKKVDETMRDISSSLDSHSPFYLLARIAIHNWNKAWQTTAHSQTLVNEAQIACALERYRLVHGEYPETLDDLAPHFIQSIPHDIIGGQPLHYRRTGSGKFLLYSVGWNETDDGGSVVLLGKNGNIDYSKGDWVWKN
ncbi:MAG TPA: hypothetical protein VGY98_18815 [Verrucomicrobiae bacterium]|nr:hypothetical protein [Verrucomicrobiae bacterium]